MAKGHVIRVAIAALMLMFGSLVGPIFSFVLYSFQKYKIMLTSQSHNMLKKYRSSNIFCYQHK